MEECFGDGEVVPVQHIGEEEEAIDEEILGEFVLKYFSRGQTFSWECI